HSSRSEFSRVRYAGPVSNPSPIVVSGQRRASPAVALLDVSSAWDAETARRGAARRELPLEVRRAAITGFGAASAVGGAAGVAYVVVIALTTPAGAGLGQRLPDAWPILVAAGLCAAMAGLTRLRRADPDVTLRLGFVHFVAVALLLALARHAHGD